MEKKLTFPEKFLWGSATSAYQIEGGIKNCDWVKFKDAGMACDHYNRYEKDFDLLKNLNQNAFCLSIEWSRIEPEEGKFDEKEIEHYKKVLLALKERGITSFVTLYHWTNPLWFKERGGWLSPESPELFERFVKKVVERLKEYNGFWLTINEPLIYSANYYFERKWMFKKKSLLKTVKTIKRLIKAHQGAYKVIHQLDRKSRVSVGKNNMFFEAQTKGLTNKILVKFIDYFWNHYFLNKIRGQLDFIGLHYYFYIRVNSDLVKRVERKEKSKFSDIGWEINPEGILRVLRGLKKYNLPVYITEHGLADARDKYRKDFIKDHLFWIHRAIGEGIDVKGYLHWSLMDNFEWERGFGPRFGLVEVNYKTFERKPRPSAFYYAQICKNNSLII